MERELSTFQMEINIVASLLMDCLRGSDSINGEMPRIIAEILNKDIEMVMGCGSVQEKWRATKVITCWTANTDMECIIGETGTCIKAILWRTRDVARVLCFLMRSYCTVVFG